MKTRNGYVSNSSSSSFILMYNEDSSLVVKGRKRGSTKIDFTIRDLMDLIDHSQEYSSDSTQLVADGIENVESYLNDKDSYGCYNYDREYADEILAKLEKNKDRFSEATIVKVSYHDKFVRKMLDAFVDAGEVVSLDEQED